MPLHFHEIIRMSYGEYSTSGLFLKGVANRSEKPLIVLIHGSGVNARYWDNHLYSIPKEFSTQGYDVLNIQRSGYAGEKCPETKTPITETIQLYASLLLKTYRHYCLGMNGIILIGSGSGSLICFAIAGYYFSPLLPIIGISSCSFLPVSREDWKFVDFDPISMLYQAVEYECREKRQQLMITNQEDAQDAKDGSEQQSNVKLGEGAYGERRQLIITNQDEQDRDDQQQSDIRMDTEDVRKLNTDILETQTSVSMRKGKGKMIEVKSSEETSVPTHKGKGKRLEMGSDGKEMTVKLEEGSQNADFSSLQEQVSSENAGERKRQKSNANSDMQPKPSLTQRLSQFPRDSDLTPQNPDLFPEDLSLFPQNADLLPQCLDFCLKDSEPFTQFPYRLPRDTGLSPWQEELPKQSTSSQESTSPHESKFLWDPNFTWESIPSTHESMNFTREGTVFTLTSHSLTSSPVTQATTPARDLQKPSENPVTNNLNEAPQQAVRENIRGSLGDIPEIMGNLGFVERHEQSMNPRQSIILAFNDIMHVIPDSGNTGFLEPRSKEELAEECNPIWEHRLKNEIAPRLRICIQYMISDIDVLRTSHKDVNTALSTVASWFENVASMEKFVLPMARGPLCEIHSEQERLLLQGKRDQFCQLITQFFPKEIWWNNALCTDLTGRVLYPFEQSLSDPDLV